MFTSLSLLQGRISFMTTFLVSSLTTSSSQVMNSVKLPTVLQISHVILSPLSFHRLWTLLTSHFLKLNLDIYSSETALAQSLSVHHWLVVRNQCGAGTTTTWPSILNLCPLLSQDKVLSWLSPYTWELYYYLPFSSINSVPKECLDFRRDSVNAQMTCDWKLVLHFPNHFKKNADKYNV